MARSLVFLVTTGQVMPLSDKEQLGQGRQYGADLQANRRQRLPGAQEDHAGAAGKGEQSIMF
jgi:hypothetical protein